MKSNIATDRNQSQRLLSAGVKAETADMCIGSSTGKLYTTICKEDTPAWSLSRLLELMPKRIKRGDWSDYTLSLNCDGCFWDLEYTYARYCGEDDTLVLLEDTDPKEACVKAIEWLTANGYPLNQTEV